MKLSSYPEHSQLQELFDYYQNKRYDEAEKLAISLSKSFPEHPFSWKVLGAILNQTGRVLEALIPCERSVLLEPNNSEAHNNLANTLLKLGRLENANESCNKAILLNPKSFQAYFNHGNILKKLGNFNEAVLSYHKAIDNNNNFYEAYNKLGNILWIQGELESSIKYFQKSITIEAENFEAFLGLGLAYKSKDDLQHSKDYFQKAFGLQPKNANAFSQAYNVASLVSDWSSTEKLKQEVNLNELEGEISLYGLLAMDDDPKMHLKMSSKLSNHRYQNFNQLKLKPYHDSKRIKIGFFSSYFRQHPVSILSIKMLESINKEEFEIYAFHYGPETNDEYNLRVKEIFDSYQNVSSMSDKDIAILAQENRIDIAIEFNGFMKGGRVGILAYRPAPIQINFLAYPGTMGASFYDYIIADEKVIPAEQKNNYSENIIYLPDCYMPQDNSRKISNKQFSRTDFGLSDNNFVFCCFNHSFKITSNEFDIWMRLLANVKGSVLWLFTSNNLAEINLKNEAQKRGINPSRLVFAKTLPNDEHLARIRLADLFLDTFNFNAHTTACDALWAGIPVVTLMGKSFASRVAGSLLHALEMPELVTTTEEDYESLALSIAKNPDKVKKLKKKLEINRESAPLFDSIKYTKNLEKALKNIFNHFKNNFH